MVFRDALRHGFSIDNEMIVEVFWGFPATKVAGTVTGKLCGAAASSKDCL